MAIVTGDRYLEYLVKFVEKQAHPLLEGTLILKLNPVGLHYIQSRLEALAELEGLLAGAPVDYLRAYISDLGDHRALEQVRRILRLLTSLKVVSVLPSPARDPTPLSLLPFGRLKVLELRGCDLSTSAARGLLELRLTLEKIICISSTDALRHLFASRIVDIKESPVWNRLTFVSCPCNDLVLMDESLQLLPVVETLDLSRNRFAKVDNLRKCSKLRHLDLGFNQLRTIASFVEVACPIVKLVLRNNALATLRGIENLKPLEGLDLSYNIISNFSEIEILASLPSLQNLWLEGNPICCAMWYRPQVFSFFSHPEKLKLDEKGIDTKEFWKMQIILTSRQKQPAGLGFYSPAKYDTDEEGGFNTKKKKISRLASIADEEQGSYICPQSTDQEIASSDSEIRSREENAISDSETEILDLKNRIGKQEFKQWIDHSMKNMKDRSKFIGQISSIDKENFMKNKKSHKHLEDCSKYVPNSVQASAADHNTDMLESDNSFTDTSIDLYSRQYFDSVGEVASESPEDYYLKEGQLILKTRRMELKQVQLKGYSYEEVNSRPLDARDSLLPDRVIIQGDSKDRKVDFTSLTAIGEIMESHSSSGCPSSPPHYQEDILQRRHNLEEELMQLSAESYSVASSDSDTSCSRDDICDDDGQILNEDFSNRTMEDHLHIHFSTNDYYDKRHEDPRIRQNGRSWLGCHDDQASSTVKLLKQGCSNNVSADASCDESDHVMVQEADCLEKRKCKRKPKKRIVPLLEENYMLGNSKLRYQQLNGIPEVSKINVDSGSMIQTFGESYFQKAHEDKKWTCINSMETSLVNVSGKSIPRMECFSCLPDIDEVIKSYFHVNVADSTTSEICLQCIHCDGILQLESGYQERKLALLLSSENKLYVLLMDFTSDESEPVSKVVGCHKLEDVKEVGVGIGLQILSIHFGTDSPYIFITRSIEKSRKLLCLLQVCDLSATNNKCSLRSLEQIQVGLFEKHVCRGHTMSIFLYSMLLVWHSNGKEESWLPRSLFVIEGYVLLCIEDLMQFSSLSADDVSRSSYLTLDLCCSVNDISDMVIEPQESRCITLTLDCVSPGSFSLADLDKEKWFATIRRGKLVTKSFTWKLKWFSEETIVEFVALLKAMHAATNLSPFPVRYVS